MSDKVKAENAEARKASITERRKRKRTRVSRSALRMEEEGKEHQVVTKRAEIIVSDEEAESRQLLTELSKAFSTTLQHYMKFYGLSYDDVEKAKLAALVKQGVEGSQEYRGEAALTTPLHEVAWRDISALAEKDLQAALTLWWKIRNWATDELETGGRMIFGDTPQERAQFFAIRDGFIDAWRPQNQIEMSMVDVLTQTYSLYLYWSHISHERAIKIRHEDERENRRRYDKGWKSPFQYEAEAIEQAHRLADSYNRQFLRTLRQMRDLRRYAPPVIVNNGGQVNVANQQVNVTKT